jgi:nucleoside diphosphate kinase
MKEKTLFFVKSAHIKYANDIHQYIQTRHEASELPIAEHREWLWLPEEFWLDFYSHLADKYPKVLTDMAKDFAEKPIDICTFTGNNIVTRIKKLAGPTRYQDNPNWTIRGKWGPYEMPNTVVHTSDRETVERDFEILKKYRDFPR